MIALIIVLFANGFATVDSIVPNESFFDVEISAIKTIRVSYSHEIEMEDHPHYSIFFSGGSFLYSESFFDSQMWGLGVDAEFRRYKFLENTGFFLSGITGANLKWSRSSGRIEAVSAGLKLGWKYKLKETGIQIDLEPSVIFGLEVDSDGYLGWGSATEAYIGIGLGLAIH